jgi:hypothetical protein
MSPVCRVKNSCSIHPQSRDRTLTYPAADLDPSKARLTVRQRETDPRVTPTDLTFSFDGANKISINRPPASTRARFMSWSTWPRTPRSWASASPRRAISCRSAPRNGRHDRRAQSARRPHRLRRVLGRIVERRFLHDFLYLGFNEDEAGACPDGLMPHIAAGKKMFTNYRFAQPGRKCRSTAKRSIRALPSVHVSGDDRPVTGRTDGWQARCLAAKNCPKIIQTDTDLEFYQSFGSLVVTDTKGEPLSMPDNVRLYYLASLQHAATANAKSGINPVCTHPTNPLYAGPVLRALLVALEGWTADGTAPPASRYPSRADGTLVTPAANAARFPKIPGFRYGTLVHQPSVVDHDQMPPAKKTAYPMFVPSVDADGTPSPAFGCRRWLRRSAPILAGTCARKVCRRRVVRQFRIDATVREDARGAHDDQRSAAVDRRALSQRRCPCGADRADGSATGARPPAAGRRRPRLPAGDQLDCRYSSHSLPLVPAQAGTQSQKEGLDARFRGHERRIGQRKCSWANAFRVAARHSGP